MARTFGRILARIWDDKDFVALETGPQRLYCFLVSQSNLNHAGLLPMTLRKWAKKSSDQTPETILRDLMKLAEARFVVVDEDSEEVLIRTFIRNDDVYKMPRVMGAAVSGAQEIESHRLRRALLAEMDRVPLDELSTEPTKLKNGGTGPSIRHQIWEHVETLRDAFKNLDPDPQGTPFETLPETPSERVPEPLPEPLSEGVAEGVLEGVVLSPTEGDPQGSGVTRAGAGPRARALPLPLPLPLPLQPSPSPTTPPAGGDEPPRQGATLMLVEDASEPSVTQQPETADQLIAYWIENVPKRPPNAVIGRVGKSIKTMLAEGIDPADIAAGLEAWATRGKDPSVLPSIVNEVMNAGGTDRIRGGRPPGDDLGGDAHLSRYLVRAAARKARGA